MSDKESVINKLGMVAITIILLLGIGSSALAQNFQVTGKVIAAKNKSPLTGVNILEVGTQNGTTTDQDGNFSITVSSKNASLRFTYIGYKTKKVKVNNRSHITVKLQASIGKLNQVVVTALGIKQESNSISYATQSVPTAELTKVKTSNFINSLQGKTAGVRITKGTSGPGSSSRIIIRGNKSFTGNSAPLYVIN
jgi:outer membrane receptor protein involved in Fe transport